VCISLKGVLHAKILELETQTGFCEVQLVECVTCAALFTSLMPLVLPSCVWARHESHVQIVVKRPREMHVWASGCCTDPTVVDSRCMQVPSSRSAYIYSCASRIEATWLGEKLSPSGTASTNLRSSSHPPICGHGSHSQRLNTVVNSM
jgi:hypothetical protein